MPYRTSSAGHFFLLRWTGEPTLEDTRSLVGEIATARDRAGRPLVCLAVVSSEHPPPSAPVRDEMNRLWPELSRHTETMLFVLLGTGVKATVLRTLLRAMITVARVRSVTLCTSVDDALGRAEKLISDAAVYRKASEMVREAIASTDA